MILHFHFIQPPLEMAIFCPVWQSNSREIKADPELDRIGKFRIEWDDASAGNFSITGNLRQVSACAKMIQAESKWSR